MLPASKAYFKRSRKIIFVVVIRTLSIMKRMSHMFLCRFFLVLLESHAVDILR